MTPEENARLEAIERRLAWLEARLGQPVSPPEPQPAPAAPPRRAEPVSPAPPPRTEPAAPVAAPPPRNIETAVGLTWLSRVAVLTTALALAFFFKYAFENHWITEWGRVLLGLGCGIVALGFGERFWRIGQRTYGQALTAAGIAFLYLSCWAAFGLYHVVAQPAAFTSMVVSTAVAGALALRYDSQAVAMLGLAGGFATPLLLSTAIEPRFLFSYALVLDIGTTFATRRRGWRWTEPLALAGSIVVYTSQTPVPDESRWAYTAFVLASYALFAASRLAPVAVAVQLLAGPALVQIWKGADGALFAALPVAGAGLVVAERREWSTEVSAAFVGFWLSFAAWSGYAPAPPPLTPALVILTFLYALFLTWPLWRALGRRQRLRLQELIILVLNAGFYFGAAYGLLETHHSAWSGLLAVAISVVQMAAARLLWQEDATGSLLSAGVAWVLLVLAAPIQFAGYRITVAWAAEAAAITWIGVRFRESRAVAAALALFVLVIGRLALLDSRMFPNPTGYTLLLNARLLSFVVAALSLWAAAWWIREGRRALTVYLAGHLVTLWGLCLEAVGWAARTAAPQDFRSVASTSISVLTAGYAVLLVAGGVARRHLVTRLAGIVLIALVILKLYLYDIWLLGQFYRMTAFGILGVLLLAMSYLYSRFRGSIESWWRPHP